MQFLDVLFQIRMVWSSEQESYVHAVESVAIDKQQKLLTIQGIS